MVIDMRLRKQVLYVILVFFVALFVISMVGISKWFIDHNHYLEVEQKISEYVKVDESIPEPVVNVNFKAIKKINSDTVGYIYVKGTNISYPVVQASDNKYYLNHSINHQKNNAGWIFMDYHNKLDGNDRNIILYGHNRVDGIMFGTLKNTLKSDWYDNKDNLVVQFITEDNIYKYQVFSVYKIKAEDYYIQTEFEDNFKEFADTLKKRSVHDFDIELNEDDSIITLSTCVGFSDTRLVLHAKLIKDTN